MKDAFTAYIIFIFKSQKMTNANKNACIYTQFHKKPHIHVWYTYLYRYAVHLEWCIITVHQILSSVQTNVTYTVKPNSKLVKKKIIKLQFHFLNDFY